MDEGLLRTLALTPPDEFVAARNQLAKQLKINGDAESAKAVAALRRGSWTDWSLNTVADRDPQLVQRYVDVAADVRTLQTGGKGDLRQALHDLRQLTSELTRAAAKHLSERKHAPDLLELAERLSLVGGSEAASARLITATLAADVEDDTPAGDADGDGDGDGDEDGHDEPYVAPTRRKRPAAKPARPRSKTAPDAEPTPRARPADEIGRRRVERAVREAQESLDESTGELTEAEAELERAVEAVEQATAAVADANAALNAARRRQIAAKRARDEVRRDVVVATRALDRANTALTQHG